MDTTSEQMNALIRRGAGHAPAEPPAPRVPQHEFRAAMEQWAADVEAAYAAGEPLPPKPEVIPNPAPGSADGGVRGRPRDVPPSMSQLIRAARYGTPPDTAHIDYPEHPQD